MNIQATFRIQKIEVLKCAIIAPRDGRVLAELDFQLDFQTGLLMAEKVYYVEQTVKIVEGDEKRMVGEYSALFHFQVENLQELLVSDGSGQQNLHKDVSFTFIGMASSTLRGLMFGAFKGTFLHDAILPPVDLNQLAPR